MNSARGSTSLQRRPNRVDRFASGCKSSSRPFIAQRDQTDCGAACLAMIAESHGLKVGLPRLREMANIGTQGTTFWSLARAAESLGFQARGLELDIESLAHLNLPAILHVTGNHFVVLYRMEKGHALIGGPGSKLIGRNQFHYLSPVKLGPKRPSLSR